MMKRIKNFLRNGILSLLGEEKFKLSGRLHILIVHAATGTVLRDYWTPNKIVDAGLNLVRDLMANSSQAPTHIAVGTDNTAPLAVDTVLGTEVFRNFITRRIPVDKKITFQLFLATGDANGNTLEEAGIFNRSAAGDMLSRVTYAPITKTVAISATLTWEITLAEG